ncbi:MAG: His/Gly/Thr/Pro-type tRNA ligase C-terminal domain-containing protein [Thaumarchaeota archaeon]|nr:His/Gly/Thr/Pro-type tRNA ligase C-terminal domain-containing protein [Nitrososphaerota archaeon]
MPKAAPLPDKLEKFGEWYDLVSEKAELADVRYGVKGFVVFRPNLMHIVRAIYSTLERDMIASGHRAMLFPLLIPFKNLLIEKEHVKGFENQVFSVEKAGGEDLEEKLFIRPTSETAIYPMYALWIRSYRDLPFKAFQSCAVYRYETKATRPLFRGREFLWIESHDVFAKRDQAEAQLKEDLEITKKTFKEFALPFLPIEREPFDRFPGAERSVAYDVALPDKQVLQSATTHLLGKRFTQPFEVSFLSKEGERVVPESTCFGPGVSRIAALVVSIHGDQYGLVLPFKAALVQVVIIPIRNEPALVEYARVLAAKVSQAGYSVKVDDASETAGEKFYRWEMLGTPVRIEIGPREAESKTLTVTRRDLRSRENVPEAALVEKLAALDKEILSELSRRAWGWLDSNIHDSSSKEDLIAKTKGGGFIKFSFCGTEECAAAIKAQTGGYEVRGRRADIEEVHAESCTWCGKKAVELAYLAKAY